MVHGGWLIHFIFVRLHEIIFESGVTRITTFINKYSTV